MDIRIEHLTKRFGAQIAVNDIGFEVRTGEVLGFLGPNGAGKTTTMRMILGSIAPDSGTITIGGTRVSEERMDLKRAIGYLPESNPLYEDMAVLDLLRFTARIQGVGRSAVDARVKEMVEVCGLEREKHKRIRELSKGYRQRTGLAQAMVHDPQVLILDEPTSGLDPNQLVEIRSLVQRLGRSKTVIFSTHILPEVEAICDRVLIIDKGRIVADASPSALRGGRGSAALLQVRIEEAPSEAVLSALRMCTTIRQATTAPGTAEVYLLHTHDEHAAAREVFALCVAHHWVLTGLHPVEHRLEDVFRDLTLN
ncbi:MAG TPA: ATP-binding cassette domain-containing protein [Flavobacteriales bacterium]